MDRVKLGVIGCGRISGIYLENCTRVFAGLEVRAVADARPEAAQQRAAEYGIPRACTVDELLADPEIELVVNLSSPGAHAALNLAALEAGKHVYTEKPFAMTAADGDAVLALARERGLRVGCAPDTFLGAALQTCRQIIDSGQIGEPYAASVTLFMEHYKAGMPPNFEEYLQLGWDALFDMGPYFLTGLAALLGPARRVAGTAGYLHPTITINNPQSPRYGDTVTLPAPTNVAAILDFHNGVAASVQAAREGRGYSPRLEIYGTEGTLSAPDPNGFGGPVRLRWPDGTTSEAAHTHGYSANLRGLGIADLAQALRTGRPHRASGDLARHVVDITLGIYESARTGQHVTLATRPERPEAMPREGLEG
jgi:predicted dehydrogenase